MSTVSGLDIANNVEREWRDRMNAALKAEREKVAQWMVSRGYATGHGDTIEDMLKELDWQIRESERKTCATDAEWCVQNHLEHLIPERIRARGESK